MASSCPSQDQQNFECVTIASVDFIKLPLKDILESRIQPVDLFKEINSCPALLSHKHKLRQDQLKLCFLQPPAEPDYRKFDVTLLYTLIRNLCPSVKPRKGWGTQPDDADIQTGDDIERLRLFRNNYYGHASSATISDVDFTKLWKDLKSVINRIQSTTKCSVDYVDELIKIERAKFTRNQLENCKVLLDALVILQQQKEDGGLWIYTSNTLNVYYKYYLNNKILSLVLLAGIKIACIAEKYLGRLCELATSAKEEHHSNQNNILLLKFTSIF